MWPTTTCARIMWRRSCQKVGLDTPAVEMIRVGANDRGADNGVASSVHGRNSKRPTRPLDRKLSARTIVANEIRSTGGGVYTLCRRQSRRGAVLPITVARQFSFY